MNEGSFACIESRTPWPGPRKEAYVSLSQPSPDALAELAELPVPAIAGGELSTPLPPLRLTLRVSEAPNESPDLRTVRFFFGGA